jgi:sortase A
VKIGDDENVLDASVGYLPDTPLPWTSGNSAFAAHRDRLFRPLKDIRTGDAIRLSTPHGELNYRVLKTMIVKPKDVWVLGPLPSVDLTLITCYPFYYVGSAPNRFVVQAEKVLD